MSICLKINTHIKLLGLVVQVFHSSFDTVHRYLQPKGVQRMTTRLQTLLSRLELSTNLEECWKLTHISWPLRPQS